MPKHVLLCDDEFHILRPAEIKLSRMGYDVETAGDGQAGWEAIERRVPDLLVTDCQMPRLDGIQLIQRIRARDDLRTLPILMLTAKGFELSHAELARELHVQKVIAKPFSPRELAQTVEAIIGPAVELAAVL